MNKKWFLVFEITLGIIVTAISLYLIDRYISPIQLALIIDRENIVLILRFIGGIGMIYLASEILRVFFIVKHPRIRLIAYKVCLFFGVFGCLKLLGTVIDTWIVPGGISGAFINNLMIFWLASFARKRRIRIAEIDDDPVIRLRLTGSIDEILDEMKVESKRFKIAVTHLF